MTIQDYNDEAPRFLPSDQYNVQVSEADGVNSIVLQVSATDDDFGQTIDFSLGTSTVDAFSISSDGEREYLIELDDYSRMLEIQIILYKVKYIEL